MRSFILDGVGRTAVTGTTIMDSGKMSGIRWMQLRPLKSWDARCFSVRVLRRSSVVCPTE